ncbi:hypothetical protein BDR22DRAFT_232743 [Usnea florida]
MGWDGMDVRCHFSTLLYRFFLLFLFFFWVEIWFLLYSLGWSSVLFFPLVHPLRPVSPVRTPHHHPFHTIPPTMQRASPSTPLLSVLSLTLTLLHLISPTAAYVTWLYPPSSSSRALSFNYNDVVYFSWESNFTAPSITLWCASDDNYYSLYTANVTTNGTDPQSFPYSSAFNQSCHMTLYCHNSSDCGPRGQSPEFALAHNNAAAAQTWGLAATASVGKAVAATATGTTTSSTATSSFSAAAKTASATAGNAAVETGATGTGPAIPIESHEGLSVSAKAGIGVGVAVGAVVVVALLWICMAKTHGMGMGRRNRETAFGVPEMMGGQEYVRHGGWVEQPRHEMGGEGRIDELQGTPQAELSSVASPVRYG